MRGPLDNGPMSTCLHVPINVHRHFFFFSLFPFRTRYRVKFVTDIKREKEKKKEKKKEINRASIVQAIRKRREREG